MAEKQGFITVGVDYGMGEGQAHMLEIEAAACEAIIHLFMTDCDWMKRQVCEMAARAFVRSSSVRGPVPSDPVRSEHQFPACQH